MRLSVGLALVYLTCIFDVSTQYLPTWESLDSRPLPSWYDEAKIGIFVHWGVFSVPSFSSEWFVYSWLNGDPSVVEFMKKNYPPNFTYADFASMFKAEFYNPDQWVDIFEAAGAKYVVLVSKHCEGFTNWPSNVSWNWNAMDVGPKRDLVGDFAKSLRSRTDLRLGLYHALDEFFNPLFLADRATGYKTQTFPKMKTLPELYELIHTYKPDLLWSDFAFLEASYTYWNSTDFLAWLYNESPVRDNIVTNDRWGCDTQCKHGGYFTCGDHFDPGVLQKHKWENCLPIDRSSWGYRRNAVLSDFLTTHDLITQLARTVSCGGNVLINVGPTADGMIGPIFEDRLREFGGWLKVNGEAIYSSVPWTHQNDSITSYVWYTSKKSDSGRIVYAISLMWPENGQLILGAVAGAPSIRVTMLGFPSPLTWNSRPAGGIVVDIPAIQPNRMPCNYAWVFRLENTM